MLGVHQSAPARRTASFCLVAAAILWWFGSYVFEVYQSQSWIKGEALITKSQYLQISKKDQTRYEYTYEAGGKTYSGTRYGFTGNGNCEESPAPYVKGQKVAVFFNPENPSQAVLSRVTFQNALCSLQIPFAVIAWLGFCWFFLPLSSRSSRKAG